MSLAYLPVDEDICWVRQRLCIQDVPVELVVTEAVDCMLHVLPRSYAPLHLSEYLHEVKQYV